MSNGESVFWEKVICGIVYCVAGVLGYFTGHIIAAWCVSL